MAKQAVTVFLEDNGVVIMEMKTEFSPPAVHQLVEARLSQAVEGGVDNAE